MNLKDYNIESLVGQYENRISHNEDSSIEDYLNLILLYWNISFDYGLESYCITNDIFSSEEISDFPSKVDRLFSEASKTYPNNKELLFWQMYIEEQNSYSNCKYKDEMLNLIYGHRFLLPYFYLKVQCETIIERELKELKQVLLQEKDSYKKDYVLSYLEDVLI
ncbi:hypothetical protein B4Q04_20160 [Zobellia sp. OII3]|uniref:hypothetical protein n=1 Tax=Zobellia sp. OII3 TaxID=2034520 RepID=UPI000B534611|nr:hypothetical protein [Zobellia sp. OII3]OWW23515.1 hypothetical protein B4Q04_20160 [Zobellia sp. OII3]